MSRTDITRPGTIVALVLAIGLVIALAFSWLAGRDGAGGASDMFDVGVADAAAAAPSPTKAVVKSAEKFQAMRLLGDESTAGPGTAGILRRKRGEYAGRLIPIDRTSACPRVAMAFFRMRADAQRSGVRLRVVNGFRTRPHQARLYKELGPVYAARPGRSLHHRATELDIAMKPGGVDRTYRWLRKHGGRHGFVQRYSWEPWHWGFVRGC